MEIERDRIKDYIYEFYYVSYPQMIITDRIIDKLTDVFEDGFKKVDIVLSDIQIKNAINEYLTRDLVMNFVSERQPNMDKIEDNVIASVYEYFSENLKDYDVAAVFRAFNAKADDYLYSVIAKNKIDSQYFTDSYACFSSWNQSTESLNFGHYNIKLEDCVNILNKRFFDCTDNLPLEVSIFSQPFHLNEDILKFDNGKLGEVKDISKENIDENENVVSFQPARHGRR